MKSISLHRQAIWAWAIALVIVAIIVSWPGKSGKLYPTFVAAGVHFRQGEPVYGWFPEEQDQFRYSPIVAAAIVPLSSIPTPIGAILWRWAQAVAFLLALRAWSRVSVPQIPWPTLALISLPLVLGNVYNAQLNPLVTALMLAGLAAFAHKRYGLAAVAIAAATMFKVYPLALGLLLCTIEPRRFTPRLLLAVAIGGVLPFAFQTPDYVAQQFSDWTARVTGDDRTDQAMFEGYHDFQKLVRRWGEPTTLATYRGMEVLAGCAMAGFLLWGRQRGWSRKRLIQMSAGLGLVWCTLFGPATEEATYMLLAPIAAQAFATVTGRSLFERIWVRGSYALLFSIHAALWFPRPISEPVRALIPQAHGALMLLMWILWRNGIGISWGQTSRSVRAGLAVASRLGMRLK